MGNYEDKNRAAVAEQVDQMLEEAKEFKAKHGYSKKLYIRQICDRLSIFDWWRDELSVSQLKQMKSFLRVAGELGYNGYVCFKVGAAGCAHGMWAHKNESETGFSPDGEFLYHSFRSGDNYYDVCLSDGKMGYDKVGRYDLTLDEVKALIA